jgi:hypothetical protein
MTTQEIDELSKDIRRAIDEKRLDTSARLEIDLAWGDLGYCVYMDGLAAQEIAQKHNLKPYTHFCPPCYFWDPSN